MYKSSEALFIMVKKKKQLLEKTHLFVQVNSKTNYGTSILQTTTEQTKEEWINDSYDKLQVTLLRTKMPKLRGYEYGSERSAPKMLMCCKLGPQLAALLRSR